MCSRRVSILPALPYMADQAQQFARRALAYAGCAVKYRKLHRLLQEDALCVPPPGWLLRHNGDAADEFGKSRSKALHCTADTCLVRVLCLFRLPRGFRAQTRSTKIVARVPFL